MFDTAINMQLIVKIENFEDKKELFKVLGMPKLLDQFILNMSDVRSSFRYLIRNNVPWACTTEHEQALGNLKRLFANVTVVAYFNHNKNIVNSHTTFSCVKKFFFLIQIVH